MNQRPARSARCIVIAGPNGAGKTTFALSVGRALRRAVKAARKIARANHTPLYVWRDGKVVAKRP